VGKSRPAFLTSYAIFSGALGCLAVIGGIIAGGYTIASQSPYLEDRLAAIALCIFGIVLLILALGLWWMKKWAYTLTLVVIAIYILGSLFFVMAGGLLGILSGIVGYAILYRLVGYKSAFKQSQ
jgi:hypothetical protein